MSTSEEEPTNNPKRCAYCGTRIKQPLTGRMRRTCSAKCRQAIYRQRHPDRVMRTRLAERRKRRQQARESGEWAEGHCLVCTQPITQPAQGRKRKTCSDACRKKLWRQLNPVCAYCKQRYKLKHHKTHRRYCSDECQQAAYNERRRRQTRRRWAQKNQRYRTYWIRGRGVARRAEEIPWSRREDYPDHVRYGTVDVHYPDEDQEIPF